MNRPSPLPSSLLALALAGALAACGSSASRESDPSPPARDTTAATEEPLLAPPPPEPTGARAPGDRPAATVAGDALEVAPAPQEPNAGGAGAVPAEGDLPCPYGRIGDDPRPANCMVIVPDSGDVGRSCCYPDSGSACLAAGCPLAQCDVARSLPGRVVCRGR